MSINTSLNFLSYCFLRWKQTFYALYIAIISQVLDLELNVFSLTLLKNFVIFEILILDILNYLAFSVLSSDAVVFRRYSRYVFQNFAIFTGKHLWRSLFLIKLQGWRSATLLKRGSNTVVFLWILKKFFGFFIENHGDCSSRILYFNECLWIFQIFSSRKYIPVS